MPTLTIDGQIIAVPAGATVLHAVRLAGVRLPTLCHWEGLPPYGACRLCLVEIRPKYLALRKVPAHVPGQIVTSCTYPVEEGLIVDTAGPAAAAVRKLMLEFLLRAAPHLR